MTQDDDHGMFFLISPVFQRWYPVGLFFKAKLGVAAPVSAVFWGQRGVLTFNQDLRVGNKYRIGRKIGSGSFGDIYLGKLITVLSVMNYETNYR